jgi:hypothetical protein
LPASFEGELFAEVCRAGQGRSVRIERSLKAIRGRHPDEGRFVWGSRANPTAIRAFHHILARAGFDPLGLPGGLRRWRSLVQSQASRLLVAIGNGANGSRPELKAYVSLGTLRHENYVLARAIVPNLPARPPEGASRLMLGYALERNRAPRPRVYLFYRPERLAQTAVRQALSGIIGSIGVDLAATHASFSIGWKSGATDMLCLGFRPFGLRGPHLCQVASPLLPFLRHAAPTAPQATQLADRLTWIALPIPLERWSALKRPAEANFYWDATDSFFHQGRTMRNEMSQSRKYAGGASRKAARHDRSPSLHVPPR